MIECQPLLLATFLTVPCYHGVAGPSAIAFGDLTGDGFLDIIIANAKGSLPGGHAGSLPGQHAMDAELHIGDGRGGFTASMLPPRPTHTVNGIVDRRPRAAKSLAMGDLNHDGVPDLVIGGSWHWDQHLLFDGNGICYSNSNSWCTFDARAPNEVLLSDGAGGWLYHAILPGTIGKTVAIAIADFNADGHMDIFEANAHQGFQMLLGDGSGRSFTVDTAINNTLRYYCNAMASGAVGSGSVCGGQKVHYTTSMATGDFNNE